MKAMKLSILAAVMLFAGAHAVKAQDVDDILKKHEKAMGGKEKWEKVKTMKFTGSLSIQGNDIPLTESIVLGKALRMDFSFMGMNGYQIVTTSGAWMVQPGQPKIDTVKDDMLKEMQKQLDVRADQELDYKSKGGKAEYVGIDSVDSNPCYKIKFTDKEGNVSTSYFDTKTYYLLRTESTVKQEDQEQEVAKSYKDFKVLPEGIVWPMSVTTTMGEIVFKTIDINPTLSEKLFIPQPPAAAGK